MTRNKPTAGDQVRWMLGGDAPEAQKIPEPKAVEVDDLRNGDTHTGTDPLGRAIGPAENHLRVKRVRNAEGEIVTPKAKGASAAQVEGRARKVAEATGTVPEAQDDPKPYTPAEVAKMHGGDVDQADED